MLSDCAAVLTQSVQLIKNLKEVKFHNNKNIEPVEYSEFNFGLGCLVKPVEHLVGDVIVNRNE